MSGGIDVKTYYVLYNEIRKFSRYTIKKLASSLNYSGRGHKYNTLVGQLAKMYKRQISLYPNLVLRTFENCFTKAYLLKVKDPTLLTQALYTLKQNDKLSYTLLLSGPFDFFVTSKYDLTFGKDFKIAKKSASYTPLYTVPTGYNFDTRDVLFKIANSSLTEGKVERKMEDWLPWEDVHFRMYEILKNNIQLEFSVVARRLGLSSNTIKTYFYEDVLPYCNIAHYFFPKGYDYYHKALIMANSNYEKGLVEAFSRMPCTTYVFPLEEEIIFIIFHESINDLMSTIRKMEERKYIGKYLLCIPLYWE